MSDSLRKDYFFFTTREEKYLTESAINAIKNVEIIQFGKDSE